MNAEVKNSILKFIVSDWLPIISFVVFYGFAT